MRPGSMVERRMRFVMGLTIVGAASVICGVTMAFVGEVLRLKSAHDGQGVARAGALAAICGLLFGIGVLAMLSAGPGRRAARRTARGARAGLGGTIGQDQAIRPRHPRAAVTAQGDLRAAREPVGWIRPEQDHARYGRYPDPGADRGPGPAHPRLPARPDQTLPDGAARTWHLAGPPARYPAALSWTPPADKPALVADEPTPGNRDLAISPDDAAGAAADTSPLPVIFPGRPPAPGSRGSPPTARPEPVPATERATAPGPGEGGIAGGSHLGAPSPRHAGPPPVGMQAKLEQIKDLYLTAEAIGEDALVKHFDQLRQRQRSLIREFFEQAGLGPADPPTLLGDSAQDGAPLPG